MSRSPFVSIVIPCYNVQDWVEHALSSAVAQTHSQKEIICVDNASIDGTAQILHSWATRYPNLITVLEEKKKGAPHARNTGLAAAKGKWVQFLDADDRLLPQKIAHQLELLPDQDFSGVVLAAFNYHESDGSIIKRPPSSLDPAIAIFLSQAGITSANLWPRKLLQDIGGWQPAYASSQEYELLFRCWQNGCAFIRDEQAMTDVYHRPGSISTTFETAIRGKFQLRKAMYPVLCESDVYSAHQAEVDYFFFKTIRDYGFLHYQEALSTYRQYFPKGFQLPDRQIGRIYSRLHHLIGFPTSLFLFRLYYRIFVKT